MSNLFTLAVPRGVRIRDMQMTTAEFLKYNHASNPAEEETRRVERARKHQERLRELQEDTE